MIINLYFTVNTVYLLSCHFQWRWTRVGHPKARALEAHHHSLNRCMVLWLNHPPHIRRPGIYFLIKSDQKT